MEQEKQFSNYIHRAVGDARQSAMEMQHEYLTPEDLLLSFLSQKPFVAAMRELGISLKEISEPLVSYLSEMEKMPDDEFEEDDEAPYASMQFRNMMAAAYETCLQSSARGCSVAILIQSMLLLEDSVAAHTLLKCCGGSKGSC